MTRAPAREALIEQLAVRLSRAFDQGRESLVVRLEPPDLGEVQVEFSRREGRLHVLLHCSQPFVLQQLQQEIDRLDRRLTEAGVDHAGVDLAHSGAGQGRDFQTRPGLESGGRRTGDGGSQDTGPPDVVAPRSALDLVV